MSKITEIEDKLLGAFIENDDLFAKCEHLVSEKLFSGVNKHAYKAILELRSNGIKVDNVTLGRELKNRNVLPASIKAYPKDSKYLTQPIEYVLVLFENRIKKHLLPKIRTAENKLDKEEGSPLDIMMELKSAINDIEMVINNVSAEKSIGESVNKAIDEVVEASKITSATKYTSTITRLDEITGGLQPGIIVIGALPGMGKTSLLINIIVKNAIEKNFPLVFFSLEMSAQQVIKNIIANIHEINTMAIRDGNLDEEELLKFKNAKSMFKDNLIIDDSPGVTWQYIDTKLTRIRKNLPKDQQLIVMVDYLQQMGNTEDEIRGKTDEAQMAQRCKGLMNLWKKHNACIIELSQLGREVAKEKRRPRMSDLKESGSIEANANSVWLLHCPDYFETNPTDNKGRDLKGICEIICDKNRGGRKGHAYANFIKKYSKFTDFTKEQWEVSKAPW